MAAPRRRHARCLWADGSDRAGWSAAVESRRSGLAGISRGPNPAPGKESPAALLLPRTLWLARGEISFRCTRPRAPASTKGKAGRTLTRTRGPVRRATQKLLHYGNQKNWFTTLEQRPRRLVYRYGADRSF